MTGGGWRTAFGAIRERHDEAAVRVGPAVESLPLPRPGEWLAIHEENGQTFDDFVRVAEPVRGSNAVVYLTSFADDPPLPDACLSEVATFVRAFFQLEARILDPIDPGRSCLTSRPAPDTGRPQVLAADLLRRLLPVRPRDAFAVLALTARDLYPHPILSFAFGQASASRRVAVCSVARFLGASAVSPAARTRLPARFWTRTCRLVAHEMGHLAGMEHCVHFRCLMNGSASLEESDLRPAHLCPVGLLKARWVFPLDGPDRYRDLEDFWRGVGDLREAAWAADRQRTSASWWRRHWPTSARAWSSA